MVFRKAMEISGSVKRNKNLTKRNFKNNNKNKKNDGANVKILYSFRVCFGDDSDSAKSTFKYRKVLLILFGRTQNSFGLKKNF